MKKQKPVRLAARDANLKRRLRRHLKSIGFSKGPDGGLVINGAGKDVIRALHRAQRNALLRANRIFISDHLPDLQKHFASGSDIDPSRVTPILELIETAIGDPVFNLSVRDKLIGWDSRARGDRLVNIMDAYVLGAVPPYTMLLGGKLVASLIRSRDIYDDFTKAYGSTRGIISKKEKKARLLAVTTSSSLGRSSVIRELPSEAFAGAAI